MTAESGQLQSLAAVVEEARSRHEERRPQYQHWFNSIVAWKVKEVLTEALRDIEESHSILLPKDGKTPLVTHYTSLETIIALLHGYQTSRQQGEEELVKGLNHGYKSRVMRLYDSAHFNDPDEGLYFRNHLNLGEEYPWLESQRTTHAYIASFVLPEDEDGIPKYLSDELIYWRAYGQDGKGCSLTVHIPEDRIRRVTYGPARIAEVPERLVPILATISPLITLEDAYIRASLRTAIWQSLGKLEFLYKDEAYKNEREARIVESVSDVDEDRIMFEDSSRPPAGSALRHYIEVPGLDAKTIFSSSDSYITLGPLVRARDDVRNSLEVLKRRAGILGPEIKFSKIPYQSW